MDNKIINAISEYAKLFGSKGYIESGYIAVRESDGIAITVAKADLNNIGEDDVVFVNDKNIESFEGNFRAAAVILFCAIRQDKMSEAAAIVDSDAILKYSSKRKPLQPVMDNVAKLLGVTIKCASKNVAAEIVTALSGYRNACLMPDAGAVIKARSLKELIEAVNVLDKACMAELLAEDKGGTQHLNPLNALIEQVVYKFTTRSEYTGKPEAQDAEKAQSVENAAGAAEVEKADTDASGENGSQSENESENSDSAQEGEYQDVTQSAQNISGENDGNGGLEIVRKVTLESGKLAALACPRYVSAVAAIGKPMTVTAEYKDRLGEEINCLPSRMILSDKAFGKALELAGETKVCFIAQHGVIVMGDSEQELNDAVALTEEACKAYFA